MTQTNNVFIITLGIITLGYLIKRFEFVTEKDGKVISKFLMHTTFPALMIVSTARINFEPSLILSPLLCIVLSVFMTVVGWFVFKNYPTQLRAILTMGCGGMNVGLFAFPIIEGIWGRDGLVYIAMFDIGNTVIVFGLIYTIGSYFATKGQGKVSIKAILQKIASLPPLHGMVIGLTINALDVELSPIVFDFLDVLAKANKPLVLLLMGIYMSFELEKKIVWAISKVLIIRYFFGIVAVALIYYLIPEASMYRNVILVCVVLPVGMTLLPFSDEFNFDSRIAGAMVNVSLLISFVLMWALVIGLKLV